MKFAFSIKDMKVVSYRSVFKLFFMLFVPSAILLGTIIFWFYAKEIDIQKRALMIKESSRLNSQKEIVTQFIRSIAADVLIMSKHQELQELFYDNKSDDQKYLEKEFIWFAKIKKIYDQVRLIDERGMEVMRINCMNGVPAIVPVQNLQMKVNRYYFKDTLGLTEGEVFVSPFDLNIESGKIELPIKPTIRFGTPVFDRDGKKRGVVILNYLGSYLFTSLGAVSKDHLANTLLLNNNGYYLHGMNPEDEWGFMYPRRKDRTFAKDNPEEWEKIQNADSGQFIDHSGMFTFTTIRPFIEAQISSTGSGTPYGSSKRLIKGDKYYWKLISYIPSRYLSFQHRAVFKKTVVLFVTMLILMVFGSGYAAYAGAKRKQTEQEIKNHRDRLQKMVEERTSDLKDANEKLKKDLDKRKQMAAEKEALERKLLQTQKMEAVGILAGGVAHDFNNMLSVIIGYAELALRDIDPSQKLHKDISEILDAGIRSKNITQQLLAFARQQPISPKVIKLNGTIELMYKMLNRLIGENIDLVWNPGKSIWPIKIDPTQIDQILVNLCVNARDAVADVGKIIIETKNVTIDEYYCSVHPGFVCGDFAMVVVSDNGNGMDKATQDKVFDPFFTTKGLGRGTGLGLSTVYGIVKQNDGFINVYSEMELGTTFRIYLPRYRGDEIEEESSHVEHIPTGHGETILIVEDEKATLELVERILLSVGYHTLVSDNISEAMQIAAANKSDISLLITDVIMPEMNGKELCKHFASHYPIIKCLFMSGYTADIISNHGVLKKGYHFIQKPFSRKELAIKVKEVLGG